MVGIESILFTIVLLGHLHCMYTNDIHLCMIIICLDRHLCIIDTFTCLIICSPNCVSFFATHTVVSLCCTKNCEKQEAVSLRHYILGQPNLFGLNFSQFLKKEEKESESIIVMKMKVKASRDTSHYILGQPNTLTQFSPNF